MTNTYTLARKIHRLFVLIILVLTLLMGGTGLLLKFPSVATDHLTFIDLAQTRYLHNQFSTYFGIVLVLMALTGVWMYFYPSWAAHKKNNSSEIQ